jgi:hypothetical protein
MAYGSTLQNQVDMAQKALDRAAIRNNGTPPDPQPVSVTGAAPCSKAVDTPVRGTGGNNG